MNPFRSLHALIEEAATALLTAGPVSRAFVAPAAAHSDRGRRLLLCHYARRLAAVGQISGRSGNLSVRLTNPSTAAITPSGVDKAELLPSRLVTVEVSEPAGADVGVSVEFPMHRACYLADPNVGAVIHTHAPALTGLGLRGVRLEQELPELHQAVGKVSLVPFSPSGSDELGEAVAAAVRKGAAVMILARHGVVAVGRDLAEAHDRLVLAELSARAVLLSFGEEPPGAQEA